MSTTEIAAVNRAFEEAVRKGDVDRLAQLYTQDAIALPPDGPFVRGRDAIKELWSGGTSPFRRWSSRWPATPPARSGKGGSGSSHRPPRPRRRP